MRTLPFYYCVIKFYMDNSLNNKFSELRSILLIAFGGMLLGVVLAFLIFEFELIINFAFVGFIVALVGALFEKLFFRKRFRKLRFIYILGIRTAFYLVLISVSEIVVWAFRESRLLKKSFWDVISGNELKNYIIHGDFVHIVIFIFLVIIFAIFISQLNSVLGKGVMLNYLTGKYHKPVEEKRIFMFLDLTASTTIAERISPSGYHGFMNDYFFDINKPISDSGGKIFQYVGDEVVITWKERTGFKNANCIRCFFRVKHKIDGLEDKYIEKYGMVPKVKAGLHFGKVVAGEVGDSKREVVYHGDVINTASRIQEECNTLNRYFLVSKEVMDNIELPDEYFDENMGKFILKGKEHEVEIHSIEMKSSGGE